MTFRSHRPTRFGPATTERSSVEARETATWRWNSRYFRLLHLLDLKLTRAIQRKETVNNGFPVFELVTGPQTPPADFGAADDCAPASAAPVLWPRVGGAGYRRQLPGLTRGGDSSAGAADSTTTFYPSRSTPGAGSPRRPGLPEDWRSCSSRHVLGAETRVMSAALSLVLGLHVASFRLLARRGKSLFVVVSRNRLSTSSRSCCRCRPSLPRQSSTKYSLHPTWSTRST